MKQLLFIILSLLTFASKGQKILWSPPEKFTDPQIVGIQGQNDGGIYIIKKNWHRQDKNVTLEHYSDDLRLLNEKTFAMRKNEHFIQMGLFNNVIHIYYTDYNKEEKKILVKIKSLSLNLIEKDKDTIILQLAGKDIEPYTFHLYRQKNDNKALFTYRELKDSHLVIHYLLIDQQLKVQTQGNLYLPQGADRFELEQAAFIDKHIAFVVRETVDKKSLRQGYRYTLYDGRSENDSFIKTRLYGDSALITEGLLKSDFKNNDLIFTGYYAGKDSAYIKGFYFWKKNLATGTIVSKLSPFTQKLIEEMSGKALKVKGIYNLRTGNIILRQDGGVILIGEDFEETKENLSEVNVNSVVPSNYHYNYYYRYNNMLIMSISAEGNMDWNSVLRKEQVTVNDNGMYSSYATIALPHKLVFLFNDVSRKNWLLTSCEINDKGQMERTILLRGQDYDAKLMPQFGEQLSYNTLLIPGSNRRGEVFLKLLY